MAKSNLPSVDGESVPQPKQTAKAKPADLESSGYIPRTIDVRLDAKQATKFKAMMRQFEDEGAQLSNGQFVNNRRRAVQYMIEQFNG